MNTIGDRINKAEDFVGKNYELSSGYRHYIHESRHSHDRGYVKNQLNLFLFNPENRQGVIIPSAIDSEKDFSEDFSDKEVQSYLEKNQHSNLVLMSTKIKEGINRQTNSFLIKRGDFMKTFEKINERNEGIIFKNLIYTKGIVAIEDRTNNNFCYSLKKRFNELHSDELYSEPNLDFSRGVSTFQDIEDAKDIIEFLNKTRN